MEEVVRWFGEGGHGGNVTREDLRYGRWMYHHHCLGNGNASWDDGLTFIYFFFFFFLFFGFVDREGKEINFPTRR